MSARQVLKPIDRPATKTSPRPKTMKLSLTVEGGKGDLKLSGPGLKRPFTLSLPDMDLVEHAKPLIDKVLEKLNVDPRFRGVVAAAVERVIVSDKKMRVSLTYTEEVLE